MELRYSSIGIATRIRGEIESAIREKSKTQKSHARVYVEGIGIEEVEDAEVADNEDQSPAIVFCPQLQGPGIFCDALAAKSDRLFEEESGTINLRGR